MPNDKYCASTFREFDNFFLFIKIFNLYNWEPLNLLNYVFSLFLLFLKFTYTKWMPTINDNVRKDIILHLHVKNHHSTHLYHHHTPRYPHPIPLWLRPCIRKRKDKRFHIRIIIIVKVPSHRRILNQGKRGRSTSSRANFLCGRPNFLCGARRGPRPCWFLCGYLCGSDVLCGDSWSLCGCGVGGVVWRAVILEFYMGRAFGESESALETL